MLGPDILRGSEMVGVPRSIVPQIERCRIPPYSVAPFKGLPLSEELFKETIRTVCPVAIKAGQREIGAPGHDLLGEVTCDSCGEKFHVAINRFIGPRRTLEDLGKQLETILAGEHLADVEHKNSYELPE